LESIENRHIPNERSGALGSFLIACGFAVVCVLQLVAGTNMVYQWERSNAVMQTGGLLSRHHEQLSAIATRLRSYNKQHGHYPSSSEGLCAVESISKSPKVWDGVYDPLRYSPRHYGQLFTVWSEPFIYENRSGLPHSSFSRSAADEDAGGRYSIKVDNGIYVWSVAGKRCDESYRRLTKSV
jgi:hypothetical protein